MQTKKITVQEALNELKTLDSRIMKKIYSQSIVGVKANDKLIEPKRSQLTAESFLDESKANVQSTIDLIKYRKALRSAVTLSNGTTKVKLGDKEMTVAEAIEYKSSIQNEEELVAQIESQLSSAEILAHRYNERIEKELLEREKTLLGNEKDSASDDDIGMLKFLREKSEKEKAKILSPEISGKDAYEFVKELSDEILAFKSNVDFVLTASNVTTFITVEW